MSLNKKRVLSLVMVLAVSLPVWAEDDCEATVDMADSLDFHKMHVECDNDPVTLYDPKSKDSFLSKNKKAVSTYEPEVKETAGTAEKVTVPSRVITKQSVDSPVAMPVTASASEEAGSPAANAGVIFNIREPFTVSGGPHSAIMGLFVQMASYCPDGWSKLEEWTEPAQTGFFLHYQFQCAE